MLLLGYLFVICLVPAAISKTLNYKKVVYAVDCGNSQPWQSAAGFTYQADQGYSPNTRVSDYYQNTEVSSKNIKYTNDGKVYMTERHADETFYYDIPVNAPGKYVLISKFSENWLTSAKVRIFNIMFGSCLAESGIDIFDKAGGKFSAFDSYAEFELKGDSIYVNGKYCSNAFYNGKLRVSYAKIGYDNPKVDGIVLFQGDLSETDHDSIPTMKKEWDRKEREEARKKEEEKIKAEEARLKRREKVKVRNDDFEDVADDYEDGDFSWASGRGILDRITDYAGLLFVLCVGAGIVYFAAGKSNIIPPGLLDDGERRREKNKEDKEKKSKDDKDKKKKK